MQELRFELLLNSPAFATTVASGVSREPVKYLKKNRSGEFELKETRPPYYPVDPRGIRIPSLRGVLEFWFRALCGHLPSAEVHSRQAGLFGSMSTGQGVSLRPTGRPQFESGKLFFNREGGNPFSFLYLGYGPLQLLTVPSERGQERENIVTSHHADQARDAIWVGNEPRSRFCFIARGRADQIQDLRKALTLLHLFGGVGSRSRRGWGSVEVKMKGLEPFSGKADELAGEISKLLATVWSQEDLPSTNSLPMFSAFSQATKIYITKGNGYSSYEHVLAEFYRHFQRVRSYRDQASLALDDHRLETNDFNLPPSTSITDVPKRLAFGMPFQPGHKNQWEMQYRGRPAAASGSGEDISRRASPLFLKVVRTGKNRFVGIALFLKSEFFGDPGLEVGAVGKDLTRPFPGYDAIDKFFASGDWQRVALP